MKKNTYRIGAILIVMTILLAGVTPASAAEKTTFTCVETFIGVLDPGVYWTNPDGTAHLRGFVMELDEWASDPRITGLNTATLNENWNKDGIGRVWGTFSIANSMGRWEGTWNGAETQEGFIYDAVGKGFGDYAGLNMRWHMKLGVCSGEIFEH